MNRLSNRQVLQDRRGFATVFSLGALAIITMFAIGVAIVNYSAQATLVSQTQNLTAAVESRANEYAAAMNTSLTNSVLPAGQTEYQFDARTALGTQITEVSLPDPSADGTVKLTITASTESSRYIIERLVDIIPIKATHVTGFDEGGNVKWANSTSTAKFTLWSFAAGSIRELTPEELDGSDSTAPSWSSPGTRIGLDSEDKLWAWGENSDGQAGVGSSSDLDSPTQVAPERTWRTVVTDDTSTFAIDSLGGLWAWGSNDSSKLGRLTSSDVPARAGINYIAQSVATSDSSTFAIDSRGRLWAWGNNADGRLGTGSAAASIVDAEQVSPGSTFKTVATSGGATYALDTAGKLYAWGVNDSGQLGTGSSSAPVTSPQPVAAATTFAIVSAAAKSAAAIDDTGKLWAWGAAGRAGDGSTSTRSTPVRVDSALTFGSVSVGATTTYAVSSYGKIFAWGGNDRGQLSDGTTTPATRPVAVLPNSTFAAVDASKTSPIASAVDSRGGLWAFATEGGGLWPVDFESDPTTAMKMPIPDGFKN